MEIMCLLVPLQIDCEENCWSTSINTLNSSLGHVTNQICVCFQHLSDFAPLSLSLSLSIYIYIYIIEELHSYLVTALISLFISLCYVSGQDALINELVDFITTAQIDEKLEMHTGNTTHVEKLELRNEVVNNSIMKWLYSHTQPVGFGPTTSSTTNSCEERNCHLS